MIFLEYKIFASDFVFFYSAVVCYPYREEVGGKCLARPYYFLGESVACCPKPTAFFPKSQDLRTPKNRA